MSSLSREEFESWLEDHKDEALDRIEPEQLRLGRWIALFLMSLKNLAADDGNDEEEQGLFGE
jgi:hypothetical protein